MLEFKSNKFFIFIIVYYILLGGLLISAQCFYSQDLYIFDCPVSLVLKHVVRGACSVSACNSVFFLVSSCNCHSVGQWILHSCKVFLFLCVVLLPDFLNLFIFAIVFFPSFYITGFRKLSQFESDNFRTVFMSGKVCLCRSCCS